MTVPEFSVIIPTYNRSADLARCLEALSENELTTGFEVVVVDDGGAGILDSAVKPWRDRMEILLVRQENAGPAAARNRGVVRARGRFLAFTDDDCRPAPGWLEALGRAARQNPECAVGGRTVTGSRNNAYGAASQAILDVVYRHKNAEATNAHFLLTSNLAVPAEPFRSIGGFNPHFRTSEDREFCYRWLISGKQMIYVPEAVVLHEGRRGLADFLRQHYGYGAGAYLYHRLPGVPAHQPRKFEPWKFYARLVAEPLQERRMPRALAIAALVVLSQFASACGYIASAIENR